MGTCYCARVGDSTVDMGIVGIALEPGTTTMAVTTTLETGTQVSAGHHATLPTPHCAVGDDQVLSQSVEAHDGVGRPCAS
jgi:hypothetical protein